ncbi:2-phospho-L-lactate transferase [Halioxenophilus sp. WMMB6]|uniref:2-phospho-L-lactate transferase n=1 Tax=Halioxenophilus sp. WMMB6 TaxID=3073815 RepID=UPI00295EE435|nr:2-phospho-L-lactate transferase [Halioxenophilus sp. WMMB6]
MSDKHYLALSGGVGGAKLAHGLAQVLAPEQLTIAVNVGDDFEHLGLPIWPDLDTVLYTLAGIANPDQGWGRADESWQVLDELKQLAGPSWFLLGDKDIALHLARRHLLDQGLDASTVAQSLAKRLGIHQRVLPVSNDPLRTLVETDEGWLEFQRYFVGRRAEPTLQSLQFKGAQQAQLAPGVREALTHPGLAGVILCPSNPYLSIMPMLAVAELKERLQTLTVPVVAVSPIVAGMALKGPAAKIMAELGVEPKANTIAELYHDFVDLTLVDNADAELVAGDRRCLATATVMKTVDDRKALARQCLAEIERLQQC